MLEKLGLDSPVVPKERLLSVLKAAKSTPELAFDFLQDLTATDHPTSGTLRVVYSLYSYRHRHQLWLKVELERNRPVVASATSVWAAANWLEREVFDLFGVTFEGHPDLRRILLPTDWAGHPLRRDYMEQGGYRDISNERDNPLDQFLGLDRASKEVR